MRKIQVKVAGVSTLVAEDELIQMIVGQDELGNDILGDYYKHYNADMTLDMVTITAEAIEKARDDMNNGIHNLLDSKAKELRYDNIMSSRSYAGYINPFQTEAQNLSIWCANCWVKAGEIEAEVVAGTRAMPTVEEVIAEMPIS